MAILTVLPNPNKLSSLLIDSISSTKPAPKTDSSKEDKFQNDLELGYNNMAAGLGLYGLAPAAAMRMAANFSSLGANPFSFPNLASSAANLASGGSAAQTAEDAMAKLWSPFFNNTATSNQAQQSTASAGNQQTTSSGQQPTTNSSTTSSSASNTTNTVNNSNINLSNIVNSSASPFASAFNPALNPLFSPLAGFQPFDITQAMRLSAQNSGGGSNNSSANSSTPTSNGNASNASRMPPLDTRSMLNAYINDLNERQAGEHSASGQSNSSTPIGSALNGLTGSGGNQTNSLPNNFNFDLFTAERYKAAAAGNFFHRFFPYNFSKPFFGQNSQANSGAGNTAASLNSQCNSNSSPSVNNPLPTSNSNGTHSLANNSNSAAAAAVAAANALKNNPFSAFGNFNLSNLNSSFGLSAAFPGLNLNNLSSNLFNQTNSAASLANLAATPMNTSLTSSTTSTTGLTANTSINSPLTPRAPSTPLSASSLSDANSLLNGSNSNLMASGNVRSSSSPRSANGQLSNNSSQNARRPSSGCSAKDELTGEDEDLEKSKLSKQLGVEEKPTTAEQMQLKNMERMVECLNQSPNGELSAGTVHLTASSNKLNGSAAIAT